MNAAHRFRLAAGAGPTLLLIFAALAPAASGAEGGASHHGGTSHAAGAADAVDAEAARAVFERFRGLEGAWKGRSTKGWTEEVTYQTIAGGSVVLSSSFDAHPNERMITTVCMDGDRLLLTHYCVARNQPRLVLTGFDGTRGIATFTFLDGTNLPSRDVGHMDTAVYHFIDDNRATERWTWYQDGEERWLEEIEMVRVRNAE